MSVKNPISGGSFATQILSLVTSLKIFEGFTKKASTSFNLLQNELNKSIGVQRGYTKGGAEVYRKNAQDMWKYVGGFGSKGGGTLSSSAASTVSTDVKGGPLVSIFRTVGKAFDLATLPLQKFKGGLQQFGKGFSGEKTTGLLGKVGGSIGGFASRVTKIPQNKLGQMAGSLGKMAMAGLASGGMMIIVDLVMQLLSALSPFQPLLDALTTIFGVYGSILEQAFTPLIEKLFEVMLSPTVISLVQLLSDSLMVVINAFIPLLDLLAPIGALLLSMLVAPLQLLGPIINLLAIPLGILITVLTPVITLITQIITQVMTYLMPIFNKFVEIFTAIATFNFSALGTLFTELFSLIVDGFVDTLVNPIIGFINGFVDKLNSWDTLNWFPDLGHIPYLAKGGIVTQPTLAMIGEAGPEAVVPLSGSNSKGVGVTINVYGEVTEEKLFRMQRDAWLNNL